MGTFNLSAITIIIILILLAVIGFLSILIMRYSLAIRKISGFASSFIAGDFKKLYLPGNHMSAVSLALNSMVSEIRNRVNDIAEERSKLEAILNCMTDGILITDTKARVVLANPAAIELLNIKNDIIGEPVTMVIRVAEIHNLVMEVISKESMFTEEIELPNPERLYIIATAAPLHSSENLEGISGVVLSLHDITRIKKLEEVRKTFVANVSHEIKTPITAIKGFAETLIDGALYDKDHAVKFLGTIKAHSERINSLVDDLLTISRIESGNIKIEAVPLDISTVIDTVFTLLADKAKTKGLYLRKTIPSAPLLINADRDRLIQILLNLVENGIKFTAAGGVTISAEDTNSRTVICVEDTGIGIAKEHLSRLGERFYRVDMARSRELGGTGLGLAIVKHLVKAHGWDLRIDSVYGKGTEVRIII